MSKEQTPKEMKEPKVRVFELTDQQNSTFKLEGTDDVFLCAPNQRVIPSVSIFVDKNNKYHRIRYIKGCPTIFFDEQEQKNWKPNITTGADAIVFTAGKLVVVEEGDGIQLIEFLEKATLNEVPSSGLRKSNATVVYREIIKEVEAQKAISNFFLEKKVYEALGTVAIVNAKGETQYKESKIDFLCSLFGIAGIEPDAYAEKLEALILFGKTNPDKFLNSIADELAAKKVLIAQSLEAGIVGFEGNKLVFTDAGGKVIVSVKSKEGEDRLNEVVDALLSPKYFQDLQQLELQLKHHNEKKLLATTATGTQE